MSIRYEWVGADMTYPFIARRGQAPDGETVDPEDSDDTMVTADFALVLGDGNPLVIEGTAEELEQMLGMCLQRLHKAQGSDPEVWSAAIQAHGRQVLVGVEGDRDTAVEHRDAWLREDPECGAYLVKQYRTGWVVG